MSDGAASIVRTHIGGTELVKAEEAASRLVPVSPPPIKLSLGQRLRQGILKKVEVYKKKNIEERARVLKKEIEGSLAVESS